MAGGHLEFAHRDATASGEVHICAVLNQPTGLCQRAVDLDASFLFRRERHAMV